MGYIYSITNIINSKRYIGKTTTTIEERYKEHCSDAQKERCEKRPLYSAIHKYGIENFIIEEIEYVEDNSLLAEREIFWINELQTYGHYGYNATMGGDGKQLYDHNEILELARLGYTSEQIQNKIGCCKDTIYSVTKAHGVKLRNTRCKLIGQYDLYGNYIQMFLSGTEAMKYLIEQGISQTKNPDCSSSKITDCCKHKSKSAYGFKWEYLPEPE